MRSEPDVNSRCRLTSFYGVVA